MLVDEGVSLLPGAASQIFNLSRGSFAFGKTTNFCGFCVFYHPLQFCSRRFAAQSKITRERLPLWKTGFPDAKIASPRRTRRRARPKRERVFALLRFLTVSHAKHARYKRPLIPGVRALFRPAFPTFAVLLLHNGPGAQTTP